MLAVQNGNFQISKMWIGAPDQNPYFLVAFVNSVEQLKYLSGRVFRIAATQTHKQLSQWRSFLISYWWSASELATEQSEPNPQQQMTVINIDLMSNCRRKQVLVEDGVSSP